LAGQFLFCAGRRMPGPVPQGERYPVWARFRLEKNAADTRLVENLAKCRRFSTARHRISLPPVARAPAWLNRCNRRRLSEIVIGKKERMWYI